MIVCPSCSHLPLNAKTTTSPKNVTVVGGVGAAEGRGVIEGRGDMEGSGVTLGDGERGLSIEGSRLMDGSSLGYDEGSSLGEVVVFAAGVVVGLTVSVEFLLGLEVGLFVELLFGVEVGLFVELLFGVEVGEGVFAGALVGLAVVGVGALVGLAVVGVGALVGLAVVGVGALDGLAVVGVGALDGLAVDGAAGLEVAGAALGTVVGASVTACALRDLRVASVVLTSTFPAKKAIVAPAPDIETSEPTPKLVASPTIVSPSCVQTPADSVTRRMIPATSPSSMSALPGHPYTNLLPESDSSILHPCSKINEKEMW
jgi:hypothetical protein